MTTPRNHTGHTFGAVEVLERISGDNLNQRIDYRIRWRCCGTEAVMSQRELSKMATQPVRRCWDCRIAGVPPVQGTMDLSNGIRHPQWGLLFPLTGPFGHRHCGHNTHATDRRE